MVNRPFGRFAKQAEIDAQYDAGAAVSDYADYLARYRSDSATLRETSTRYLQVAYGPTLAERLDIFPVAAAAAPVLVFFHGGYWRSLSAGDFSFVARGPRARGYTTVLVDYALCPWVSLDEVVRQARAAIAWVHGNIGRYGGDPRRMVVSGHSAGGHLAVSTLLTPWRDHYGLPQDVVRAVLPISGIYDLAPLRYSYLQPALQLDEGTIERNSPVRRPRHVDAPMLLAWGTLESEEFARQSLDLFHALTQAGSEVRTLAIDGAHHFSVLDGFLDPDSAICDWLGSTAHALR